LACTAKTGTKEPGERFASMSKKHKAIAVFAVALGLAPIAAVAVAAMIAGVAGCDVNESAPLPCEIFGADIGGVLYALVTAGWLALITIPALMIASIAWLSLEAIVRIARRFKDRRRAASRSR
jgi:hypothetical protein